MYVRVCYNIYFYICILYIQVYISIFCSLSLPVSLYTHLCGGYWDMAVMDDIPMMKGLDLEGETLGSLGLSQVRVYVRIYTHVYIR